MNDRAMRLAEQFMGRGRAEGRPMMPRGLSVANMGDFAQTPAGASLIDNIRQRVSRPLPAAAQAAQARRKPVGNRRPGFKGGPAGD